MSEAGYDQIGLGYAAVRKADPRIAARIWSALGDASRIVNLGAGSGSYEPSNGLVVAVEPSVQMIAQRSVGSAPVLRGVAERLPFPDDAFDAAMAILTVHHWTDPAAGLAELRRVTAGPVVVFTFDRAVHEQTWLIEYLPEAQDLDVHCPDPLSIADALGGGRVEIVPVPHDCGDGFAHAYWRRPEVYLDPAVRAGISCFSRLSDSVVARAMGRLRHDIASGRWSVSHAGLLELDELDAGFRPVIAS